MPATLPALDLPPFLTPPAIARLMGVQPSKVVAWIEQGELFASNTATAKNGVRPRYKIPREAFEEFLKSRSPVPAPKTTRRKKSSGYVRKYY